MSDNAKNAPVEVTDEWGTWHEYPNGVRALIEPSQKWLDEHPEPEPLPEPEPEPEGDAVTWDALAEAYAEGVNSLDK